MDIKKDTSEFCFQIQKHYETQWEEEAMWSLGVHR